MTTDDTTPPATPAAVDADSAPEAPSGVTPGNQATTVPEAEAEAEAEEEEEEEEEADEETEERERRSISSAVAAVRASAVFQQYDEASTYLNTSTTEGIEEADLRQLKNALNIKGLDKLVSAFHFRSWRNYRAFSLEGVFLKNNTDLISYLNKCFNKVNPSVLRKLREHYKNKKANIFSYNRYTMKCTISLPPGFLMQLPVNLGLQLGFGGGTFLAEKTEGNAVVDLKFRAQTVYVYSDIVKHTIVGDKKAPLLRLVNVNPLLGETQTVAFQPLIYQPVSKTSFKEIGIYLRDGTGSPIPFERGAVNVVLAFRPVSNHL